MSKKVKRSLYALVGAIIIFICGIFASQLLSGSNPASIVTNSEAKVETSKDVYTTSTDTTEAIKVVQDAVVSVITYQTNASDTSLEDLYSQIFGGNATTDDSVDSEDGDLSIYSEGSGVIYKKEGDYAYLVTNNHVISGAEEIEIMLANGTKVAGEIVGSDTYSDLAVVKIAADKVTTVAEFADSSSLTVGEPAIAIGSPLGSEYANSVTQGIVSSLSRTVTGQNDDGQTISTNAIQTDAAINPGNSGGPLINIHGQIIGINSSKISASGSSLSSVAVEGMGFAIPSNDVVSIINQLEASGSVERPALGIRMGNLSEIPVNTIQELNLPADVTNGILVISVQADMPAEKVLQEYDLIVKIDDQTVDNTSDLQSILYKYQVGDTISITFYRDGKEQTEQVKLTKSTQDLNNQD